MLCGAAAVQMKCGTDMKVVQDRGSITANTLYWSKTNVMFDSHNTGLTEFATSKCDSLTGAITTYKSDDPTFRLVPDDADWTTYMLDPRPEDGSKLLSSSYYEDPGNGMDSVKYSGAFAQGDLWLVGLSWLDENGQLPVNEWGPPLCGDITADKTLEVHETHFLTCQTFVLAGATLTIEAGTTILALADDGKGKAPALVIEQGAKIEAKGTKSRPITFTSALPKHVLPRAGTWGGVILLGKAPIRGGTTKNIEGLPPNEKSKYGGSAADDDSGTLTFVRVWYGGRDINPAAAAPGENSGNEINGITFGGVGSKTTVENCEVAFNKDDGFEM